MIGKIMNGIRARVIGERGEASSIEKTDRPAGMGNIAAGQKVAASTKVAKAYLSTETAAPADVMKGNNDHAMPGLGGGIPETVDTSKIENDVELAGSKLFVPLDIDDKIILGLVVLAGYHSEDEQAKRLVRMAMNVYSESVTERIDGIIATIEENLDGTVNKDAQD